MNKDKVDKYPLATSIFCPHCGTRAQFNLIFPTFVNEDEFNKATYKEDNYTFTYTILRCQVCHKLLFRAIKNSESTSGSIVLTQYPSRMRIDTNFDNIVPREILEDFESALKCYEFDEYRASVAMARRSLQASILEQGANKTKHLIDQIDELNNKYPEKFTIHMKDWAHNIRIFGNWGAHPDDDHLKDVTKDIAEEVIKFLKAYFTYVYVLPQNVAKARETQKTTEKQPKNK